MLLPRGIGQEELPLPGGSIGLVIRPFDKSFYPKVHTLVKIFLEIFLGFSFSVAFEGGFCQGAPLG